jgi:hypothetical protein
MVGVFRRPNYMVVATVSVHVWHRYCTGIASEHGSSSVQRCDVTTSCAEAVIGNQRQKSVQASLKKFASETPATELEAIFLTACL